MNKLTLVRAEPETLSPAQAQQIADLLYQASPQFYDLIPLPKSEVLDAITAQIGEPGTEFADTFVDLGSNGVRAAVAVVDATALDRAKSAGLARFLRLVPAGMRSVFFQDLSAYGKQVPPLNQPGRYIARISVAESCRGHGLAAAMIYETKRQAGELPVLLHVHEDNSAAIRLYSKLGFERISDDGLSFGLWQLK